MAKKFSGWIVTGVSKQRVDFELQRFNDRIRRRAYLEGSQGKRLPGRKPKAPDLGRLKAKALGPSFEAKSAAEDLADLCQKAGFINVQVSYSNPGDRASREPGRKARR